jgi:Zn-dependent protease
LPLPPLDGSRVLFSILPNKLAYQYIKLEKYGLLILVVLLITGVLAKTIGPIIAVFERLMHALII